MLAAGVASAVVGGIMCVTQRHVKRLLAFSTICHAGIMLIGCSLFSANGEAGVLLYMLGHGLAKGALFMTAGILLATLGGIDELGLRGLGRQIWPAGIAMAAGGLLLAGAPVGLMEHGTRFIEAAADSSGQGWLSVIMMLGGALTGGAVMRAAGRIFLGAGAVAGDEKRAPTEEEQEKSDRPLWLMLAPCAILLLLSLIQTPQIDLLAARAVGPFVGLPQSATTGAPAPLSSSLLSWTTVALAILIAGYDLSRSRLPGALVRATEAVLHPLHTVLEAWHSGLVGDYVTWIVVGLALMAGWVALASVS
jgi:multicomponent Na+:H+ antiporter subunit D